MQIFFTVSKAVRNLYLFVIYSSIIGRSVKILVHNAQFSYISYISLQCTVH